MILMLAGFFAFFEALPIIPVMNYTALFLTLASLVILITVWSYRKFQMTMLFVIILNITNLIIGGMFIALENGYFRNV
jgi:CHASE2 domain-containing sensor protein